MITTYFIFYLLIYSIYSNPIVRNGNDICQINGYFLPSNGYTWIQGNNQIICTCPDFSYEINQPCRICNRLGICGPQDALCSEEQSNFISINNTSHITCFCSSGLFIIGDKCPQPPTTIRPLTTTIQQTNAISTTTTLTTTTPIATTSIATTPTTTAITTIPITPPPPLPTTATTTAITIATTITTTITTSRASITTISMSTTVSTKAPTSVPMSSTTPREETSTTPAKDTTITTTASPCDIRSSSSYLFVKPLLIILLNLVYFVNK